MLTLSARDARRQFGDLAARVYYTGEQVAVTKRGRIICYLVPAAREDEQPDKEPTEVQNHSAT